MVETNFFKILESSGEGEAPDKSAFYWLINFRWVTCVSLIFLVLVANSIFEVNISLLVSGFLVLMVISSNIFFYVLRQKNRIISLQFTRAVMFFDVGLLTALFMQISCALNPFVVLYIVYVFLGAMLLKSKSTNFLIVFTMLCYAGFFFFFADPMVMDEKAMKKLSENNLLPPEQFMDPFLFYTEIIESGLRSYSNLLFTVIMLTLITIGLLVNRMKRSMDDQQKTIDEFKKAQNKTEKLASLATFAAGAAHEFATPLSTIAVASGEMLYYLGKHGGSPELIEDSRLIREQVGRCKEILYQMSADAGENLGESTETFLVDDLVAQMMVPFNRKIQEQICFTNNAGDIQISLPVRTLIRTLRGLLKNARDASEPNDPVFLTCRKDEDFLYFEVRDYGRGMDDEAVERATEPFFTTKDPGKGMGLGLYLAQLFVVKYEGSLDISSKKGKGTTVTISFADLWGNIPMQK